MCVSVSKSLLIVWGTLPLTAFLGYGKCRPMENRFPTGLGQTSGLTTLTTPPTTTVVFSFPEFLRFLIAAGTQAGRCPLASWGPSARPAPVPAVVVYSVLAPNRSGTPAVLAQLRAAGFRSRLDRFCDTIPKLIFPPVKGDRL